MATTGLDAPLAEAMVRRGLIAERFGEEVLAPDPPDWRQFLTEAEQDRLKETVQGRSVLVFGDYDVDGLAATAMTVLALGPLARSVSWRLPNRFLGGYGLSLATVEAAAEDGVEVLVTVDCGITAVAEVARARELGLSVVVVDHHLPGDALPQASVTISPVLAAGRPPLCGAGLALILTWALAGDGAAVLDLAALGTLADQVPLLGANRWIVQRGLAAINQSPRPGLAALLEQARLARPLSAQDLAFRIAPRLNSLGRMGSPDDGVRLLLAEGAEARTLAQRVETVNAERREGLEVIEAEGLAALADQPAEGPILLAKDGWSPGLIGILASRLAGRTGRPAVVAAVVEEQVIGSARAPLGCDVRGALGAAAGLLSRYGGHAQAAGFETTRANLPRLWQVLRRELAGPFSSRLPVDGLLPVADAASVHAAQDRLAPFGASFEPLRWMVATGAVGSVRQIGEGGRHLAFTVGTLPAVWWSAAQHLPLPPLVDVAGQLEPDPYTRQSRLAVTALRPSLWTEVAEIWLDGADQADEADPGPAEGLQLVPWPGGWPALADRPGSLLLVTADLKAAWAGRLVERDVLPFGPGLEPARWQALQEEGWVRAWVGYWPPKVAGAHTLVFLDPPTEAELGRWRAAGWRQAYLLPQPAKGAPLVREDILAAWRRLGKAGPASAGDPWTAAAAAQVLAELGLNGGERGGDRVDLLSSPTFARFGCERSCVRVTLADGEERPQAGR